MEDENSCLKTIELDREKTVSSFKRNWLIDEDCEESFDFCGKSFHIVIDTVSN